MYPVVKSTVVYRGVNLEKINFSKILSNKPLKFLYLGGLSIIKSKTLLRKHPIKSFDVLGEDLKGGVLLLKAWKQWQSQYQNLNAELYFGGPNVTIQKVKRIIGSDLENLKIFPIGVLEHEVVLKEMIDSNVIIVPSYAEGLPNVAMESFSIGRPVIGSDVGGILELISHKDDGFIFTSGNKLELIKALEYFQLNKDNLLTYSKNARMKVEKYFDSKKFINSYNKLYINEG